MDSPCLPNIPGPVEKLRPLGDLILVKRIDEPAKYFLQHGIWLAPHDRKGKPHGLRLGTVVACGPGDTLMNLTCDNCGRKRKANMHVSAPRRDGRQPRLKDCPACGSDQVVMGSTEARGVDVKPGDTIAYWRVPANEVRIDGQDYEMLHEEIHIEAVLEAAA